MAGSTVAFMDGSYGMTEIRNTSLAVAMRTAAVEATALGDKGISGVVTSFDSRFNEWCIHIYYEVR